MATGAGCPRDRIWPRGGSGLASTHGAYTLGSQPQPLGWEAACPSHRSGHRGSGSSNEHLGSGSLYTQLPVPWFFLFPRWRGFRVWGAGEADGRAIGAGPREWDMRSGDCRVGGREDMTGKGPLRQEHQMAQSAPLLPSLLALGRRGASDYAPNASCEPGTTTSEPASILGASFSGATGLSMWAGWQLPPQTWGPKAKVSSWGGGVGFQVFGGGGCSGRVHSLSTADGIRVLLSFLLIRELFITFQSWAEMVFPEPCLACWRTRDRKCSPLEEKDVSRPCKRGLQLPSPPPVVPLDPRPRLQAPSTCGLCLFHFIEMHNSYFVVCMYLVDSVATAVTTLGIVRSVLCINCLGPPRAVPKHGFECSLFER